MLYTIAELVIKANLGIAESKERLQLKPNENNYYNKICIRCRNQELEIKAYCIDCRKAYYCSQSCLKKNRDIHSKICRTFKEFHLVINAINKALTENEKTNQEQEK